LSSIDISWCSFSSSRDVTERLWKLDWSARCIQAHILALDVRKTRTGEFMPLLSQAARLVDEVARNGSIRRAAARVNASPSAVNRQILNLEAELGVALFERLPNGMRLTAAGDQFWSRSGVGAGLKPASKRTFRN
jgi:hypothetical protein